jgi:hypothetical protein
MLVPKRQEVPVKPTKRLKLVMLHPGSRGECGQAARPQAYMNSTSMIMQTSFFAASGLASCLPMHAHVKGHHVLVATVCRC